MNEGMNDISVWLFVMAGLEMLGGVIYMITCAASVPSQAMKLRVLLGIAILVLLTLVMATGFAVWWHGYREGAITP